MAKRKLFSIYFVPIFKAAKYKSYLENYLIIQSVKLYIEQSGSQNHSKIDEKLPCKVKSACQVKFLPIQREYSSRPKCFQNSVNSLQDIIYICYKWMHVTIKAN